MCARSVAAMRSAERACEPRLRAETEREERLRVGLDLPPGMEIVPAQRRQAVDRRGLVQRLERLEDRFGIAGPPRRRPVSLAQVLDDEDRQLAVVVPPQ